MAEPHQLGANAASIHKLFADSERWFQIPGFQRRYVWQAKGRDAQVDRLWSDIRHTFDSVIGEGPVAPLFLGTFVVQELSSGGPFESPMWDVIDGQQRLLTLYLALLAIAQAFEEIGDHEQSETIHRRYLVDQTDERRGLPRIAPGMRDRGQFNLILLEASAGRIQPLPVEGASSQSGTLMDAWDAVQEHVRKIVDDPEEGPSPQSLRHLLAILLERVEVVVIGLGGGHDPNEIFERLNTTGKTLDTIDKVRNFVLQSAGPDLLENDVSSFARAQWDPFEERLGMKHEPYFPRLTSLVTDQESGAIRAYEMLRDRWRSLYLTDGPSTRVAEKMMAELTQYLPAYEALAYRKRPTGILKSVWESVDRLHRLYPAWNYYFYLLPLVQGAFDDEVDVKDLRACVNVIDSFTIRRGFAGNDAAGLTPFFRRMWKQVGSDSAGLAERMQSGRITVPGDEDFAENIMNIDLYHTKFKTYVLYERELAINRGDLPDWQPSEFTVDHVMPQQPKRGGWKSFTKADQSRLVHSVGNLVLMSGRGNSIKGTKDWAEARETLRHSQFAVTSDAAKHRDWTPKIVEQRTRNFRDWALRRWPKP